MTNENLQLVSFISLIIFAMTLIGGVLFYNKYHKPDYNPENENHTLHERIVMESHRIQIEDTLSNIVKRIEKLEKGKL